jgi:SAM-dependent methyltransferase
MPERYGPTWYDEHWLDAWWERVRPAITPPGLTVLDVGSGRRPIVPVSERSPGTTYIGLDVSGSELELAGSEAYDERIVADAADRRPELDGRCDVVLSHQVFEHVRALDVAVDNIAGYLKPGGRLVTMFSGTFSAFGIVNRVLPEPIGFRLVAWRMGRDLDDIFPAYYHACYDRAVHRLFASWSDVDIVPLFRGADYFAFNRWAHGGYLAYEEWARLTDRRNLATHYLVTARR